MQISPQAAEPSDTWWNFSLWLGDSKTRLRMIEEVLLSSMTKLHGCIRHTILRKALTHHGLHESRGP